MNNLFTGGKTGARHPRHSWSLMLPAFWLLGCAKVPEQAPSTSRVVVLGASVAEIVCDLGGGDRVVGLDQSSEHLKRECPRAASLNYFRQLSSEGVLALGPDLVLTTDQAGPPAAVEQIKGSGVKLVALPESYTWNGAVEKINAIAGELAVPGRASDLLAKMEGQKKTVEGMIQAAKAKGKAVPKVVFVMSQIPGSQALMVAGTGTGAQAMIELAGGENVVSGFERYKQMSNEALVQADPDIVLFAMSPHHGFQNEEALRQHPALKDGTAVREGRVHGVDLGTTLNFGSRLGDTLQLWAEFFYAGENVQAAAHVP